MAAAIDAPGGLLDIGRPVLRRDGATNPPAKSPMRIPTLLLTGATLLGPLAAQCSTFANTPSGTNLQLADDSLRTVGLGFPFTFHGVSYNTITVCSNGFVWLGTVGLDDFDQLASDYFDNENDLLSYGPRIAVCWDDWNPAGGGTVEFRSDGSSASVVWKNVAHFGTTVGTLNAELVLASTNEFFIKIDAATVAPGSSCIVGSSAGGGAAANSLTWSTTLPGIVTNCTGYQLFTTGTLSLMGQIVQQIPTAPAAIDHLAQAGTLSTCAPGTYPALATAPVAFGSGCPAFSLTNPSAIYEAFTPTGGANPTDLSGLSIKFLKTGSLYVTTAGGGLDTSYLTLGTPVPQFDESIATGLTVGPMGQFPFAGATFTHVDAAANGFLVLESGTTSDFSPTAGEFLGQATRIAPHWSDYDFTFAGTFYWQNNDPNFCMATWANAEMYSQPGTSNTFQVKLFANGDITFSYGTVASAFDDVVVGITLGHGAIAPGASNLDAAISTPVIQDLGALTLPLELTASGPASINTTLTLAASGLNGAGVGVFVIGGTATNIDLTSLGMPACSAYCSTDQILITFVGPSGMSLGIPIPATPGLIGATGHVQAAAFAPVNAFGLITSNRQTLTIGL